MKAPENQIVRPIRCLAPQACGVEVTEEIERPRGVRLVGLYRGVEDLIRITLTR